MADTQHTTTQGRNVSKQLWFTIARSKTTVTTVNMFTMRNNPAA
jgi:hypothetical protein